ncbi:MAG TPA: hydroxymethylbilane synthase [Candidatus Limnocylindria bacterium]|nr:hydroxymethylbilane synthase [Candidatus Limnocylindria bacterium]
MIVVGTRGSALALAQARIVAEALGDAEIRVLRTAGDASERPIRELGDGVFVTAIEDALRRGDIDLAVHSLKDLPTADAPDLVVAAVPQREDPRDVVITQARGGLADLRAGARVGTSSPRRAAFLGALVPGIVAAEIRGNVDTRLRKVSDGRYDAAVLAAAGLRRLGIAFDAREALSLEQCPPAPGQGALAIQTRADDPLRERVRQALDDEDTHRAVDAERALLRLMGASCDLALGCHARWDGRTLVLDAALAEGGTVRRASARGDAPETVAGGVAAALGVVAHA